MAHINRGSVTVSSARNPFVLIKQRDSDNLLIRREGGDESLDGSSTNQQSWDDNFQVSPENR